MNPAIVSAKARIRGLFVFILLLAFIAPGAVLAQDPAPDANDGDARNVAAVRTAPPELAPTQESIRRRMMRAQIKIEGENKFRYARELEADGYLVRSRQLLEDFLILFPGHDRRFAALQLLARIAEQQDQTERAVVAYRRAYAAVPGEDRGLESALQAGRLLAGLGRTDEARKLFLEIQGRKPDSKLARLVAIELQALGLPVVYDRLDGQGRGRGQGQGDANNGRGNYTTENAGDVRQNSGAAGRGEGSGTPDDNSGRGLLDGTVGVPTDDGTSTNSGGSSTGTATDGGTAVGDDGLAPNSSAPRDDRSSRTESNSGNGAPDGAAGLADEALSRMGEGVERPRSRQ
ncbi:MAG: hypothetical protein NXI24_17775 [bacterium]|nr:hypothetical protein [bacterium]